MKHASLCLAVLTSCMFSLPTASAGADAAPRARPNILFIMSDDHAAPAISAYGSKINKTPHIDRLAQEGMRFDNCFVTNSICTPSRAVIFTGLYSHLNGCRGFTPLNPKLVTLPKLLQAAGYYTGIVGKYHLMTNPRGFDYFAVLPGQGKYFDPVFLETGNQSPTKDSVRAGTLTTCKGYVTDVITDKTLECLKGRPKDRPFAVFYQHKAPHDNFEFDEKHAHLYGDGNIPEPPTLFDDYATRSDAMKKCGQKVGLQHTRYQRETGHLAGVARKKAQYQEYMKRYLRCVASIDDNVGRVLDYLDEAGLSENTIVIYTADQGFFLGEHGLYDKRFMYDEAIRMPLLIRWPGKITPGSVNGDIVLNLDFAPTLLSCAGVGVPAQMQGASFLPQLLGKTPTDWRDAMYYRYYFSHFNTEPHYGVRTQTHKLIYFHRMDAWELFDLKKDPLEMQNVYGDSAYADVTARLKQRLGELREQYRDTAE